MELQEETITGVVEEITFQNDQNGFTVLDFSAEDELFTAVGVMPGITAGETVSLTGNFVMHPTFGRQLKVTSFTRTLPETSEQIIKYLSSGVIRGIGPKKALLIVETFGTDTLNVIENTPERLAELKGISLEQAKNIGEEFKKQYAMRTVMLGLEKYGLTPNECVRIYKKMGIDAVELVKENPYRLCSIGIGISFDKAVSIEEKLEEKPVPECRIKEGILHVMRHNRNTRGHTCIPREKLLKPCADLLSVTEDTIDIIIDSLVSVAQLKVYVIDGSEFIFLPSSYRDERKIAE
ncbi:MAG: ATP-dependent RecD-like DNA helicase, partial [Clostridia bacterium]|nr:ATP-dependent RecD-like DNA helicase [Clostridia bacterium]